MRTAILILAGLTTLAGVLMTLVVLSAWWNGASAPVWPELLVMAGGAVALFGAACI